MRTAYVDTSCLASVAFGEPTGQAMAGRLRTFDELVAANLLEADLATALYLAPDPSELTFLTLDQRQQRVAAALGFAI